MERGTETYTTKGKAGIFDFENAWPCCTTGGSRGTGNTNQKDKCLVWKGNEKQRKKVLGSHLHTGGELLINLED